MAQLKVAGLALNGYCAVIHGVVLDMIPSHATVIKIKNREFDVEDRRNLILAILLTGLVLFGWPYVANYFFPTPQPTAQQIAEQKSKAKASGSASNIDGLGAKAAPKKSLSIAEALQSTARVKIDTPRLSGSINLEGGKVDDILLLDHREALAEDSPKVRLFAPSGTQDAYYASFGWVGKGAVFPDDKTVWTPSASTLSQDSPVTLDWTNAQGQKFAILFSIDANYMINVTQTFTNTNGTIIAPIDQAPNSSIISAEPAQQSAEAVEIAPTGFLIRSNEPAEKGFWNLHVGPMGVFNDVADYDWGYDDVEEAPNGVDFASTGGWLGFTDKYWLGALIPDQKASIKARFSAVNGDYQTIMVRETQDAVAPGASISHESRLFAGAKEVEILDKYTDEYGVPKFDLAIDWGWFRIIEKFFFAILHWFFGVFENFGLAIIGLTLVVRGIMFPIAQKQFASMAQMRALQPKMKKIQEKFKEDKTKQQQEIMKLYKEEKANPLAGCLPILIQIPIFFALYKLLLLSIEMRHQPFFLWIKDLSVPDPLTPVNLFGLLPFTPPAFIAIGILPILLGLSMWGTQRLNPQPMDEMQKQIFGLMPWFLMFVMAPFAAGLQLYWVVSNVLTIAQQKWLYSRHPQLKEQMAKDAADKAAEKAAKKAAES